jgi:hypothetical protein
LESGQEEIERRNRQRKEAAANGDNLDLRNSVESIRSPATPHPRSPALSDVPEESGAFAIGDDEDDSDDNQQPTPSQSTASNNPSQASSTVDADDAVPTQLRGMSEKARGKLPAGAPTFSRQNSTTSLSGGPSGASHDAAFEPTPQWIESWLPELPLHTMLSVIQQLTALLPRQMLAGDLATTETLRRIQEIQPVGVDPSPIKVQTFEWSPLALGWYESLLWGFVFSGEMQLSKGTVGIWNGTAIRLFKVQETVREGPSLTSPRGAVDALGRNMVDRIGSINLRQGVQRVGSNSSSTGAGQQGQAPQQGQNQRAQQ